MGSSTANRRAWWLVVLLLGGALVGIGVFLLPAIGSEEGGRRRLLAVGTPKNAGLSRPTETPDEDEVTAAAPEEEGETEPLPPLGDTTLGRTKAIRGKITDYKGNVVPDAIVIAAYKNTDSYPYVLVQASRVRSDEDGTFVLGPLGSRSYWILAVKKGVGVAFVDGKAPGAYLDLVLSPGARIKGKVRDQETGLPVADVVVSVSDWSFWTEVRTDENGDYEIAPLPPTVNIWSGHRVMAMAEGYQRAERNNLILKNKTEETIDFDLTKGGALKGTVVDAQSLQPVPNATIAEGWESYHQSATSSENGEFELKNVDAAPNRIFTVRAEGFLPQQRQSDGTGKMEFKLNKSAILEGVVLDLNEKPAVGARVYLHRIKYAEGHQPSGGGSGRWRTMTTTDEKGKFKFEAVLPGEVAACAFATGFAPGETQKIIVQLGVPPPADIKVQLKEGATVEGEVRDTQEKPIPGIRVELQRWGFRAKGYKYAHRYIWYENPHWYSDEKGKFVLRGAIPGSLWLSVWDRNYGWTGKSVQAQEGQRIDGVILSFAGEAIEGVFLDQNGDPVPGAWINAQGPKNTPRQNWRWTSTDALGRFKLAGLEAGDYDIQGSLHSSQADPLKDIPAGTKNVELKLRTTQVLRGSVKSVLSGRALTQFRVQITPQRDANNRSRGGTSWSGEIKSPDGRFERPVKPGIYSIAVKSRGHAPQVLRDIVVEEHVPPLEQFFQLDQGGGIKGVLRGLDGKPIRSRWVNATIHRAAGEQRQPFDHLLGGYDTTDSQGQFFIEGVAPGTYMIQMNMGSRGSANAIVSVTGSEMVIQDLQLVPAGKVLFVVVDADTGKGIRGASFQIRDPNTNNWIGWSNSTDNNGRSQSGSLRSGPAKVTVRHSKYTVEPFEIHIEGAKTTTVNVEMIPKPPKEPAR